MSITNNPEIVDFDAAITTNAVANTQTSTALVAAPGAGKRIRIYGIGIASKPNNTGAIRCIFRDTAGTINYWTLGIATSRGSNQIWFPNGIPVAVNTAIEARHDSDVVSQPFNCNIAYVIETV